MSRQAHPQVVDHTGEIIGGGGGPRYGVRLHGMTFSESGTAAGTVKLYVGADLDETGAAGVNVGVTAPSAAGTLYLTINLLTSATFNWPQNECGIYFKNGLFIVTSESSLTGLVYWS